MNRQCIDTFEKCRECTLFGKNPKPTNAFNTANYLPTLSGPNQELQLDLASPLSDENDDMIYLLVAIDRYLSSLQSQSPKQLGRKKSLNF